MRAAALVSAGLLLAACGTARAVNVYVMSSGDATLDNAVVSALTAHGHTATVGVQYTAFDGTVSLKGFQTVYLQCNFNWTSGLMPVAGQTQLINWVNAGGRLVTSEWVVYYTYPNGGKFETLGSIIPAVDSFTYASLPAATYTMETPHPVINAGVTSPLTFPMTSYTGTETFTTAKLGATVYYSTGNSAAAPGLLGWAVGSGNVFSFMSTCGLDQVSYADFGRLFANVMGAVNGSVCYANCDGSSGTPQLTGNDFVCFVNAYATNQAYANCDGSTGTPTLTGNDFVCFINEYAGGCN